ncbi:hypothetical protein F4693_001329 [Sphingomonas endophytica]|uniref:Uncharacterized protein n=1 Tax=Sphingomonas endophytica TaxID=869719 RepID=A0A7X0JB33_9SPHN|nr:hypothetical protein [Sphingomonas endophytica]MBB6504359.1 hypothetical protein [Sphingomonas endophytica]
MIARRFERALLRDAVRAGVPLVVEHGRAVAWHSATFSGARHELVVSAATGSTLDAWLTQLPTRDVTIPGQIVADLRVATHARYGERVMLRIEGVTVACDLSAPECGAASVRARSDRRMPPPTPACNDAAPRDRTR